MISLIFYRNSNTDLENNFFNVAKQIDRNDSYCLMASIWSLTDTPPIHRTLLSKGKPSSARHLQQYSMMSLVCLASSRCNNNNPYTHLICIQYRANTCREFASSYIVVHISLLQQTNLVLTYSEFTYRAKSVFFLKSSIV